MLKGLWGLYPWFEEDGQHLVEPSQKNDFSHLNPYGKVFQCVDEDTNYISIKYNNQIFKVIPTLFKEVPPPIYTIGERVQLVKKPEIDGEICDIQWHHSLKKEMYFIKVEGRKKSSRYFSEDLTSKEDK
ncbi:DUF6960 family protein [Paenibacillus sp. NRS-1781]|uniref:DUF6960 family protein n=1 Tax=unclassified Paenibacillus TaxID=185978 RepID=UPI003D2D01AB